MKFFLMFFSFACILNISMSEICKDIDVPPLILQCNSSTPSFTYKSNSGVLTEITFASNPNPNKYEIVTNLGQNIRTLTIKTLDKYDSGSDTYYTNVDGEKYCTYDILIFSKNKSF